MFVLTLTLPVVERVLRRVGVFLCFLLLGGSGAVIAACRRSQCEVSVSSDVGTWVLQGTLVLRGNPLTISERSRDARCSSNKESSSRDVC